MHMTWMLKLLIRHIISTFVQLPLRGYWKSPLVDRKIIYTWLMLISTYLGVAFLLPFARPALFNAGRWQQAEIGRCVGQREDCYVENLWDLSSWGTDLSKYLENLLTKVGHWVIPWTLNFQSFGWELVLVVPRLCGWYHIDLQWGCGHSQSPRLLRFNWCCFGGMMQDIDWYANGRWQFSWRKVEVNSSIWLKYKFFHWRQWNHTDQDYSSPLKDGVCWLDWNEKNNTHSCTHSDVSQWMLLPWLGVQKAKCQPISQKKHVHRSIWWLKPKFEELCCSLSCCSLYISSVCFWHKVGNEGLTCPLSLRQTSAVAKLLVGTSACCQPLTWWFQSLDTVLAVIVQP